MKGISTVKCSLLYKWGNGFSPGGQTGEEVSSIVSPTQVSVECIMEEDSVEEENNSSVEFKRRRGQTKIKATRLLLGYCYYI